MNSGSGTSLSCLTRLTLPEDENEDDIYNGRYEVSDASFDEEISREEVIASIRNLKLGKSAGPDKIVSEMLKHVDECVIDFFVQTFNKLYDDGIFPEEWSRSITVPIHIKKRRC